MRKISTDMQTCFISVELVRDMFGPGPLLWDRAGMCVLIPAAVIRNAIELFQSGKEALDAGLIASIPKAWTTIPWDSGLVVPVSSKVKVTNHV